MKTSAAKLFLVALITLIALSSAAPHTARAQTKDEHNMGRMQLVFLLRAADWKPSDEAHAARLQREHRSFVNGLIESGRLALGGPVEGEGDLREIMVFKEGTLSEALALVAESPAVKARMLTRDGLTWYAARNYITPPKKPLVMTDYVFGLLVRGPKWTKEVTEETKKLQEGHMANINRLAQAGKLVLAGPFVEDGDRRGVFIFKVPTLAEAQALTDTDPAVAAGRLKIELHRWSVPEGTLK